MELGFSPRSIEHRLAKGRLHRVIRGVYAVGRPDLTRHGHWMAAVLGCGPKAVLSHGSAAALWELGVETKPGIAITVRSASAHRRPGICVSRRPSLADSDIAIFKDIPVTSPPRTILDLAIDLSPSQVERCINEADKRDLTDPEALRVALDTTYFGELGAARLRKLLDRRTFRLTASDLERRFRHLVIAAGLSPPLTGQDLNGFEVDFFWPDLGLVVETDGLRYHRTPTQQARDHLRDQAHTAAGLTPLRFTHAQISYETDYVKKILTTTVQRIKGE